MHQTDEVNGSPPVELAATVSGICKRIKTDPGEMTRLTSGDVAVEMGDDTLREVVGLYRA
jgi:hypothetical protein